MRKIKLFLFSILIIFSFVSVISCSKPSNESGNSTKEYYVSFDYNFEGAPAITVLKTSGGIAVTFNPDRDGYDFKGWFIDNSFTEEYNNEKITKDIVLYAKWQVKGVYYNIEYYDGETKIDSVQKVNGEITLENYTTKEDKRFEGWIYNGVLYKANEKFKVEANVVFTAKITQLYKISFDSNGGNGNVPAYIYIARGEKYCLPEGNGLTFDGYSFIGWAEETGSEIYAVSSQFIMETSDDVVLYAKWSGTYSLSYDADGGEGEVPDAVNYISGSTIIIAGALIKDGYSFKCWTDGVNEYSAGCEFIMPNSAVVLKSVWIKTINIEYYYNYYGNDEIYLSVKMNSESKAKIPTNPTREDYTFVNWYKDAECTTSFSFTKNINEDSKVYAKWEHNYLVFSPSADGSSYTISAKSSIDFTKIKFTQFIIPDSFEGKPVTGLTKCPMMSVLWPLFNVNRNSPVTSLLIPKKWTEICDYAFATCKSLETVQLEAGCKITKIGKQAFNNCENLISYPFDGNLTEIGEGAFLYCKKLKSADLSETSVTEIPYQCFMRCFSLGTVKYPKNIIKIGDYAFSNCISLPEIRIPEGVTYLGAWSYSNAVGVNSADISVENDDVKIYCEHGITNGVEYYNYYHSIATYAYIPGTVTTLGRGAFAWEEALQKVEFGSDIKINELNDYMFFGTQVTNFVIPASVTALDKGVFMKCTNLDTLNVPKTVTGFGRRCFEECNIKNIVFESGIIINFNALNLFENSSLQTVAIPDSVTIIADYCFYNCTDLTKVTFGADSGVDTIWDYAFAKTSISEIQLPESLRSLRNFAFAGTKLTSIEIPANLTNGTLDENAENTSAAGTWLGAYVFAFNSELVKVSFEQESKLEFFGFYMFSQCEKLTDVILSENIRTLNNEYVKQKYGFDVGAGYTNYSFYGCNKLLKITVPESNNYIKNIGNNVYSKDGKIYMWHSLMSGDTEIADGTEILSDNLFFENKSISAVTIPSSIKKIGNAAFEFCKNITEIVFEEGSALSNIGNFAFANINTYPTYVNSEGSEITDYDKAPIKTNFLRIIFKSTVPPTAEANILAHSVGNENFEICVPALCGETYKSATGWAQYAQYIKSEV